MLVRILAIVAGIIGVGTAAWYLWPGDPPPPPPPARAAPAPPPAATGPRFPVETQPAEPLPALKESDPVLVDALAALMGSTALKRFLNLEDVVRRIVATVDNLPRESYATRLNPVKPIGGAFMVSRARVPCAPGTPGTGTGAGGPGSCFLETIAPANAERYSAFVGLAESIDVKAAAALYRRFYPLFQQAYLELGYPGGYFNDRLVAVIDHLLATPEVRGPVELVAPRVMYEFADAELEERSSGQKVLLRMGPDNAARIKARLRELRAQVSSQGPPG